jgi:hypothetical protein
LGRLIPKEDVTTHFGLERGAAKVLHTIAKLKRPVEAIHCLFSFLQQCNCSLLMERIIQVSLSLLELRGESRLTLLEPLRISIMWTAQLTDKR